MEISYIMRCTTGFKEMSLKLLEAARFSLAWSLLLFSSVSCWGNKKIDNAEQKYNDHTNVQVVVEAHSEGKVGASVVIDVEPGWHIYAEDPGDVGMPTKFWFEDDKVRNVRIEWPKFSRTSVQLGKKVFKSNTYKGVTRFPITFEMVDDTTKQLQLNVSYAVCGEMCIPVQHVLNLEIPAS